MKAIKRSHMVALEADHDYDYWLALCGDEVYAQLLIELESVYGSLDLDINLPHSRQYVADLVNMSAKGHPYWYYWKAFAIVKAIEAGAVCGRGDNRTYVLYTRRGGVSHYHDPYDELRNELRSRSMESPFWNHVWSGIERQGLALDIIRRPELADDMAQATQPGRRRIKVKAQTHRTRLGRGRSVYDEND